MTPTVIERLKGASRPVDASGVGFFRMVFGLIMLYSTIRYWWMGWINEILLDPTYHFTYAGFSWVKPLAYTGMHFLFLCMAISAL